MKIFITGGTGFLGYNTILRLLSEGHSVYALVRRQGTNLSLVNHSRLHLLYGSLEEIESLKCETDIDSCIHFAWGGVNRDGVNNKVIQQQNVNNTLNLLSFLKVHQCQFFIDAGSRQEYAPCEGPISEESPCNPVSEYGKWKLEAYHEVCDRIDKSMGYAHLRIFSTYGYGDHPWSLINTSIEKMIKGEPMELGLCRHFWSFLYIDDFTNLVSLMISCSKNEKRNEVYNVGSGFIQPLCYFVNSIKNIVSSDSLLQFGKFTENKESTFPLIPNISKANYKFGWNEKVTFEDGIKTIIKLKNYDKSK